MTTAETAQRHARLFELIHQQARADYTALRLKRRADRRPTVPDTDMLIAQAARSWADPARLGPRG